MNKWCPRCQQFKLIDKFPDNGDGSKYGYCKSCKSEYMSEYARTHPGNYFAVNLRRVCKQRGITTDDYWRMLREQNNACAICKNTIPSSKTERFSIDHDHQTDTVRGLLCSCCNTALGMFQDKIEFLEAAVEYLLKHKGNL